MHATITETAKLLCYRTRATLYRLVSQGHLDDYLWELDGKRYLYMGKKKGKTLAQHIKSLVFDKNGFETIVSPSNVDEDQVKEALIEKGANPEIISKNLAELKSIKVGTKFPDQLVLGADSVISLDSKLINKPISREEAFDILKLLNGQKHYLIS